MQLIPGVEVSVTWRETTLHVLGLRIDPGHRLLVDGLAASRAGRVQRARKIAASLDAIGIVGSLAGARSYAANEDAIGRNHFARFLVACGCADGIRSAFQDYLVPGRPAYVTHQWPSLASAVHWITASGGVAVLAHPAQYRFDKRRMGELLSEFRGFGGGAIEVVSGNDPPERSRLLCRYAREFGLACSAGSDFHGPGEGTCELGRFAGLPRECVPVWRDWDMGADSARHSTPGIEQ